MPSPNSGHNRIPNPNFNALWSYARMPAQSFPGALKAHVMIYGRDYHHAFCMNTMSCPSQLCPCVTNKKIPVSHSHQSMNCGMHIKLSKAGLDFLFLGVPFSIKDASGYDQHELILYTEINSLDSVQSQIWLQLSLKRVKPPGGFLTL